MTKTRNWLFPLVSALLAATAVVVVWLAWAVLTENSQASRTVNFGSASLIKGYSSIGELSDDADFIVVGTVTRVAETGKDYGRDSGFLTPLLYTLYEVEVLEVVKGDVDDTIYVLRNDPESFVSSTPLTRLTQGETSVFYLYRNTPENVPAVTTATKFIYVPLAFDMAILDISSPNFLSPTGRVNGNAVVTPRGTGPGKFAVGTTFQFSELREAVANDN